MNQKPKNLIIYILIGLVILFCGWFLGRISLAGKLRITQNILATINSPVTTDLIASGTISKIEGKNITVSAKDQSLTFALKEDAKILDLPFPLTPELRALIFDLENPQLSSYYRTVGIDQLRVNDPVNIYLEITPKGEVRAKAVLKFAAVYSAPQTPQTPESQPTQ